MVDQSDMAIFAEEMAEDSRRAKDADLLRAEVKRLRGLVRTVELYGTGFVWRHPDGRQLLLHPADVDVVIAADQLTEREQAVAAAESRGRREGQQWAIDALRAKIEQAILDEAPTWTEDFDAGPGQVCGVPDAAVVASHTIAAWLRDPTDVDPTTPGDLATNVEEGADG